MKAMQSAGENADAMLERLTLRYNSLRQTEITEELTEITSAAKALRKKKEKEAARGDLHLAHDPRIDRGAHEEGEERGHRGAGNQAEKRIEGLRHRDAALLQRAGQPADQLRHHRHESAEHEGQPDDETRLAVTVDLCYTVVQDVRYREQKDGAGQLQRQSGHLPQTGDEKVGRDQTDDQRHGNHQKSGAEMGF